MTYSEREREFTFANDVSFLGASPQAPNRGFVHGPRWGTSVLQTPSLPTPGKNPAGAHGSLYFILLLYFYLLATAVTLSEADRP